MTTITATATIAPNITGLTVTNDIPGVGLNLRVTKAKIPGTNLPPMTEFYVAKGSNNRNIAVSLGEPEIGYHHKFSGIPNELYYFWAKNYNTEGVLNGAFFPVSATGGISGVIAEISGIDQSNLANTYIGNNTAQKVAEIVVTNSTGQDSYVNILWSVQLTSSGASAATSLFQLYAFNNNTSVETLLHTYNSITSKEAMPSQLYSRYFLQTGQIRTFRLYWQGQNSSVTLTRPQMTEFHNYNNPLQ